MEKTIHINGRPVRFKSTGGTPMRYRKQFHEDFFAALLKLSPLTKAIQENTDEDGNLNFDNFAYEQLSALNFETFENIIWVMAKTADPDIPEPLEWFDGFEEGFPVNEVFSDIQELMFASISSSKSKKNHPAIKKTTKRR